MGKSNITKGKKKKKICLKPAIDVQNEGNKNTCAFCHQPRLVGNEVERAGNLYKLGNRYYHYFCVLFCQGMDLGSGKDEEGLNGFLIKDVHKGLKYSSVRTCYYCGRTGAGLHCNSKSTDSCYKKYHFTCATQHGKHTFIFSGMMDTFCPNHSPKQRFEVKVKDMTCLAGCQEKIEEKEEKIMISPCCGRKYHLSCIQGMASASGKHHFKCPACSVKEQFLEAAIAIGVYVPDQDAAWEKDSFYDFDAQGRLYQRCDAKICQCPKGREHHFNGSKFEIVRCESCGSAGVHILCGNLLKESPLYICEKHSNNERQMLDHKESVKRNSVWRGSEDENSDEDESLSNTDSFKPLSKVSVIRKTPASEYSISLPSSDEEDSDYVPEESAETTETSDTDKNKANVPNITSNEVPTISSNEALNMPSNELPNTHLCNLIDTDSILIDDDTTSKDSDEDESEDPVEVQKELSMLFQQSKQSPIKTYQLSSTNMQPFALKHPTTHKRVALLAPCSFSSTQRQMEHNVTPNTNLACSHEDLKMTCSTTSSFEKDLEPASSGQTITVNDRSNCQESLVIRNSGDLLESNQGFCPTIEMTFSMANVPGDFPNMNGDSKHPEVVTTKIVGFDSDDVVELESDDEIVCIDDSADSSIDYCPREDLMIEGNNMSQPFTSTINAEETIVHLD